MAPGSSESLDQRSTARLEPAERRAVATLDVIVDPFLIVALCLTAAVVMVGFAKRMGFALVTAVVPAIGASIHLSHNDGRLISAEVGRRYLQQTRHVRLNDCVSCDGPSVTASPAFE